MKGKIGLVIGLAAGYVLGARAGRERYNQIAKFASSVWNTAPVQKQVGKAKEFAKSSAMALPGAVWDTAVKVTKAERSSPQQQQDQRQQMGDPWATGGQPQQQGGWGQQPQQGPPQGQQQQGPPQQPQGGGGWGQQSYDEPPFAFPPNVLII